MENTQYEQPDLVYDSEMTETKKVSEDSFPQSSKSSSSSAGSGFKDVQLDDDNRAASGMKDLVLKMQESVYFNKKDINEMKYR